MISAEFFFDDEEDEIRSNLINLRRRIRDSSNPLELENSMLSKAAFVDLLERIKDKLKISKSQRSIPNVIKLAATLKFFAQGSYQLSVGNDFNLGLAQPTVSIIIKEVLNVMEEYICSEEISFQYTQEEERRSKIYFYEKSKIPNVIGCIDGTHVKIISPKKEISHVYYNRKGFYSLNVMIIFFLYEVCDHVMKIRYINAKFPGSYHDSNIWNISGLRAKLEDDYVNGRKDIRLLGDSGYPLLPYLLTPYRNAEEQSLQSRFNQNHAKGRNIVERTIGLLKSRFRCSLRARELHYKPEKAVQIINVCAALHNICIKYNVEHIGIENLQIEESQIETNNINEESSSTPSVRLNEGRRIRDSQLRFM